MCSRKLYILFLTVLLPGFAQAQASSTFGRMETAYTKGCAPFTVNINETDNLGTISRTYTYEQGINPTSDTFYTYTSPGRYEIIQLLGEDIVPKTDTLRIEVLDNYRPLPSLAKCDQNRALIRFPDSLYDSYLVNNSFEEITIDQSSNWEQIINFGDTLNLSVIGLYQDGAPNCQLFDSTYIRTANTVIQDADIAFTFICSGLFTADIQFTGNPDQLYQIQAYDDFNPSIRSRLGNWSASGFQLDSISTTEGSSEVCIQINALSACDSSVENNYQYCESLAGLNNPLRYAYATYQEESIVLYFDTTANGSIAIQQRQKDELIHEINVSTSPVSFDELSEAEFYNFDLVYQSQCPDDSIVYALSPPSLASERIDINHYKINIQPATYHYPNLDLTSTDLFLTGKNGASAIDPETAQIRLSNEEGYSQVLQYIETLDTIKMTSNRVLYNYEYYVYVPDVFTPNEDGLNDELVLYGLPTDDFTFKVFNRWGEKVFETKNTNNFWRGRLSNGHIVEGTYVYLLKFYNSVGELFTQQGSFAVIRD